MKTFAASSSGRPSGKTAGLATYRQPRCFTSSECDDSLDPFSRLGDRNLLECDWFSGSRVLAALARPRRRVRNFVDHVHALGDTSEDGVILWELTPQIVKQNEELTAVCVRTRVCHSQRSALIVPGHRLVREFVSRSARTSTSRIAALNHKPFDDTMERRIVEVSILSQANEVVGRHRSIFWKELHLNRALIRFNAS